MNKPLKVLLLIAGSIIILIAGATTSVSYQLSILKKDLELKNKSGNTFVSEQEFDVEWTDDDVHFL